jgi:hypothetical protein
VTNNGWLASWNARPRRIFFTVEQNILCTALFQRSHPMADRLSAGDTVRVAALRGSVLPDPLGAKEPEYFL